MKLGILGAGAIGSHLGASFVLGGGTAVLVSRKRLVKCVTAQDPPTLHVKPKRGRSNPISVVLLDDLDESQWPQCRGLLLATNARALRECDVVLVCTKAQQLQSAAASLVHGIGGDLASKLIICCANGFEGHEVLEASLQSFGSKVRVYPLVANYNVVWSNNIFAVSTDEEVGIVSDLHSAFKRPLTLWKIHAPALDGARQVYSSLCRGGVRVVQYSPERMKAVQFAKTCTNLFNSLNALSGLSVRDTILDADYRAIWVFAVEEALQVFRASGTEPANIKVPVWMYSVLLSFPTPLVKLIMAAKLDPHAKSSMLQDLEAGKTETEVEFLNLAVARMGSEVGILTPINHGLGQLVESCAAHGKGSPHLSAHDIAEMLGLSEAALAYHRKQLVRWVQLILGCVLMNVVLVLAFLS